MSTTDHSGELAAILATIEAKAASARARDPEATGFDLHRWGTRDPDAASICEQTVQVLRKRRLLSARSTLNPYAGPHGVYLLTLSFDDAARYVAASPPAAPAPPIASNTVLPLVDRCHPTAHPLPSSAPGAAPSRDAIDVAIDAVTEAITTFRADGASVDPDGKENAPATSPGRSRYATTRAAVVQLVEALRVNLGATVTPATGEEPRPGGSSCRDGATRGAPTILSSTTRSAPSRKPAPTGRRCGSGCARHGRAGCLDVFRQPRRHLVQRGPSR